MRQPQKTKPITLMACYLYTDAHQYASESLTRLRTFQHNYLIDAYTYI